MILTENSETDTHNTHEKELPNEDKQACRLHQQPANAEKNFTASDNLEVLLSFQVGHLKLPLKELRQIGPGFTFDLQKRLIDHRVSIFANGMLFATGELVSIGDFIGVRIISLSEASDMPETSVR